VKTRSGRIGAAPIILLGQPFWQSILDVIEGNTANLKFQDREMSPQEMLPPFYGGTFGVSLVVVNLLKTSVTGTNCLECDGCGWNNIGMELQWYPCIVDPVANKAYSKSQIPGMMPYPNPSRHGNGDPENAASWLGAIGLYNFFSNNMEHADCDLHGGIAFSTSPEGSGTLLGVTFRQAKDDEINLPFVVCADLSTQSGTSPEDQLLSMSSATQHEYSRNGKVAIGARLMTAPAKPKVLLVWVMDDPGPGDVGSGFGVGSFTGGDEEGGDEPGSGEEDPEWGEPGELDPFGL
jgi:hypothetical protein